MKLLLSLLLVLATSRACFAQHAPTVSLEASVSVPGLVASPVTDSVRQAVHQLYKRGRLVSTVGGISGVLLLSSGVTYVVKDGMGWQPSIDILLGGSATAGGLIGRARYSRRQERLALAALAQGNSLPPYVAQMVPLISKRNRQLVLSSLYR
jgi:hypothetical protein